MVETSPNPLEKYQFLKSSSRFTRMRTRGAIPPPFAVIQIVTEIVRREYEAVIAECVSEAVLASSQVGKSLAGVSDATPYEDLSKHLIRALAEKLRRLMKGDAVKPEIVALIRKQLADAQTAFFTEFQLDADEETQARVVAAFTRDETFEGRLEAVREGYLKTAIQRIGEGKSDLRKQFITVFGDWIEGRGDLTDFEAVTNKVREEAGVFSKFFSRDQFSRFNRALSVSLYQEAGAKWVTWVTVNDARVRKSHRALNNKTFRIDDLPEEYLSYSCRCALLPVFDIGRKTVTKGDGITMKEQP